jgi:hypothetical protein
MAQFTYYIQSIWHNTHIKPHSEEQTVNFCCAEKQIICSMHGGSKCLKHYAHLHYKQKFINQLYENTASPVQNTASPVQKGWLVIFTEIIAAYSAKYSNLPGPIYFL